MLLKVFLAKIALVFLWHNSREYGVYECVALSLCTMLGDYTVSCYYVYTIIFVCPHVCSLTVHRACNAIHIWVSKGTMKITFLKISSGYKSINRIENVQITKQKHWKCQVWWEILTNLTICMAFYFPSQNSMFSVFFNAV